MARPSTRLTWVSTLFAQPQSFDDLFVPGCVFFGEIRQLAASFAHHLEQAATRMIIMCVGFEVLDQLINARRK